MTIEERRTVSRELSADLYPHREVYWCGECRDIVSLTQVIWPTPHVTHVVIPLGIGVRDDAREREYARSVFAGFVEKVPLPD